MLDAIQRYAWVGGVLFVVALVTEAVISVAIPIDQEDTAAKIAKELGDHHQRLVVAACLSILYAVGFLVYLTRLHDLLRRADPDAPPFLSSLVLIGGTLFVTLHGVSDIGIYAMLGAKVATYAAGNDPGVSYTLYLLTFALDSVGDVFGSLFVLSAGGIVLRTRVLPRWLGWLSILVGIMFFLQGFGLGGVVSQFGLILDIIGFVALLGFVLVSSVILLMREARGPDAVAARA